MNIYNSHQICISASLLICFVSSTCFAQLPVQSPADQSVTPRVLKVTRLPGNPIISPKSDPSIGTNINGPSLIRVPKWVVKPLGTYYLYFADHNGKYIRLAYANKLQGPWKIYTPGTLQLAQSFFTNHIASPDVIIDETKKQILKGIGICTIPQFM